MRGPWEASTSAWSCHAMVGRENGSPGEPGTNALAGITTGSRPVTSAGRLAVQGRRTRLGCARTNFAAPASVAKERM